MRYDIKHIFLLLMTSMACMVSCSSNDEPGLKNIASAEEMMFEVAGSSTRTVATTNENVTDQPFMLFGDVKLRGTDLKTIFYWHRVAYDPNKKIWDYGIAKQYWFMGQEHSFVAIHPYLDPDGSDSQVEILTYEDSKLSFIYTLPEKMEDAKDLLFATHRRKYSLDNTGPVRLEFTHLLARINVSLALVEKELMYDHVDEEVDEDGKVIGNANEYIKVHSIEFNGIKTKASFSFTPKPLTTGNFTYDYEKSYLIDNDSVGTVTVTLKEACKVPNSYKKEDENNEKEDVENYEIEYVKALKDDEIVVMLPQSFDSDSDAEMVVNYSINEDKDLMRRIKIPLKNTEWKEGKIYTYKLLIDNAYYNHIVEDGGITVDIEDFRLSGQTGDDSWITDDEDENHNIKYGYDDEGNCGPVAKTENNEE